VAADACLRRRPQLSRLPKRQLLQSKSTRHPQPKRLKSHLAATAPRVADAAAVVHRVELPLLPRRPQGQLRGLKQHRTMHWTLSFRQLSSSHLLTLQKRKAVNSLRTRPPAMTVTATVSVAVDVAAAVVAMVATAGIGSTRATM
jgi:hypothetical protein